MSPEVGDLGALVGTWTGEGEGDYPGIDAFRYREELVFSRDGLHDYVHYEQRTWLLLGDAEEPVHWESGFLRRTEDGRVELLDVQGGGRVEVLVGDLRRTPSGLELSLASVVLAHDPRMVSSGREIVLEGDRLEYEVRMATVENPDSTHHLRATLRRSDRG